MDFKAALVYPFRRENMLPCVIIPGCLTLGYFLICTILSLLVFGGSLLASGFNPDTAQAQSNVVQLVTSPVQFVYAVMLLGFIWHQIGQWQANGFEAPAVGWRGNWLTFFVDGLKSWLFSLVVGIIFAIPFIVLAVIAVVGVMAKSDLVVPLSIGLVLLWLLVISFIAPFLQGALLQASQSKSLGDLFHIGRTVQVTKPHYWRVVWSYILVMGLGLLYLVGSALITCTVIGIITLPFLWGGPLNVSSWHLMMQAFGPDDLTLEGSEPQSFDSPQPASQPSTPIPPSDSGSYFT